MDKEKRVIIYGAGDYGRRLFYFIQGIGGSIDGFCQTVAEEKSCCGFSIFSLDELMKIEEKIIVLIAVKNMDVSNEIKLKLTNLKANEIEIYQCGRFIYDNLEKNSINRERYCNLCNHYVKEFLPGGGEKLDLFEKYHIIGGGRRENVKCPICSASDRDRWKLWVLSKHTGIFTSKCNVLHIAPETCLQDRIQMNGECEYYSGDITPGRAMHVVDLTDIQFKDNIFDYVIVNHVLEHIENETLALGELLRVLKDDGRLMLSFPICTDRETYEDINIKLPEERLEAYGQEDHVRLYGKDYKERLEKYDIDIVIHTPGNECSLEEIKKYGFIPDDVIMLCSKKGERQEIYSE